MGDNRHRFELARVEVDTCEPAGGIFLCYHRIKVHCVCGWWRSAWVTGTSRPLDFIAGDQLVHEPLGR